MGAKTWMIVYADRDPREVFRAAPTLDPVATDALARALFPSESLGPAQAGDLGYACPGRDALVLGCFDGVSVVAAQEFIVARPTALPSRIIEHGRRGTMIFHGMYSTSDAFAFGLWRDGVLIRWISLAPDDGVVCDIGERLPFEQPYWDGQYRVDVDIDEAPYPLPFHPLELGEAALREYFGYQLEGLVDLSLVDPDTIPLLRYPRLRRPWWAFWRR
ncbi:MAG TPA: hypothetical protein VGE64_04260 [Xanthomonadaceae bacterium]